ncbi:MAG: hypothetical protein OXT09_28650, partial [Myxococcales bacterium]|nr:hypothetical protein [Myxococcales bacterium]
AGSEAIPVGGSVRHPSRVTPMTPPVSTARVAAQRGRFTRHPFDPQHALVKEALTMDKPFLRLIRVNGDQRRSIMASLSEYVGVGEHTLFPDLDGLAREIRVRQQLEGKG